MQGTGRVLDAVQGRDLRVGGDHSERDAVFDGRDAEAGEVWRDVVRQHRLVLQLLEQCAVVEVGVQLCDCIKRLRNRLHASLL
jgi:hypothetical protein